MKASILILASLLGTAAVAQGTEPSSTPPANGATNVPEGPNTTSQTTEQAATPNAAMDPNMPSGANANTAAPGAGGMPSDTGAGMPNGGGMAGGAGMAAGTGGSGDMSNYPTCSRSVTDKCVQRGGSHSSGMMHKRRPHR